MNLISRNWTSWLMMFFLTNVTYAQESTNESTFDIVYRDTISSIQHPLKIKRLHVMGANLHSNERYGWIDNNSIGELSRFKKLEYLELGESRLTSKDCRNLFKQLPNLNTIVFNDKHCIFHDEFEVFSEAKKLTVLDLSMIHGVVSGLDMEALRSVPGLKEIRFRDGRFDPGVIDELVKFPSLESIYMEGVLTDLSELDRIGELADSQKLDELHIFIDGLSDEHVMLFSRFEKLRVLGVDGFSFSEEAVSKLSKALPNCRIHVRHMEIAW